MLGRLSLSKLKLFILLSFVIGFQTFARPLTCANLKHYMQSSFKDHVEFPESHPNQAIYQKRVDAFLLERFKRVDDIYLNELLMGQILLTEAEKNSITSTLDVVAQSVVKDLDPDCSPLLAVEKLITNIKKENYEAVKKIVLEFEAVDESLPFYSNAVLKKTQVNSAAGRYAVLESRVHQQVLSNSLESKELKKSQVDLLKEMTQIYERTYREHDLISKNLKRAVVFYLKKAVVALDPHTTYFSKQELAGFYSRMSNSLVGIGASLNNKGRYPRVLELIEGGALKDNKKMIQALEQDPLPNFIDANDLIIAVSKSGKSEGLIDTSWMPLKDTISLIAGRAGTAVLLRVRRYEGENFKDFNVEVVRKKIDLSLAQGKLFNYKVVKHNAKKVAVIDIESFYTRALGGSRDLSVDLHKAIVDVKSQGIDAMLIDLRNNGGGSLSEVVKMVRFFIAKGDVVGLRAQSNLVAGKSSVDQLPSETAFYKTDDNVLYAGPLIVAVNANSASASEIFAAAIKDYGRGVIVGPHSATYGKGTAQNIQEGGFFKLPIEGAVKKTTSYFYRANGKSTQSVGVKVDVKLPSVDMLTLGLQYTESALPFALVAPPTIDFRDFEAAQGKIASQKWKSLRVDVSPKNGVFDSVEVLSAKSQARVKNVEAYRLITELNQSIDELSKNSTLASYRNFINKNNERAEFLKASLGVDDESKVKGVFKWDYDLKASENIEILNIANDLSDFLAN